MTTKQEERFALQLSHVRDEEDLLTYQQLDGAMRLMVEHAKKQYQRVKERAEAWESFKKKLSPQLLAYLHAHGKEGSSGGRKVRTLLGTTYTREGTWRVKVEDEEAAMLWLCWHIGRRFGVEEQKRESYCVMDGLLKTETVLTPKGKAYLRDYVERTKEVPDGCTAYPPDTTIATRWRGTLTMESLTSPGSPRTEPAPSPSQLAAITDPIRHLESHDEEDEEHA